MHPEAKKLLEDAALATGIVGVMALIEQIKAGGKGPTSPTLKRKLLIGVPIATAVKNTLDRTPWTTRTKTLLFVLAVVGGWQLPGISKGKIKERLKTTGLSLAALIPIALAIRAVEGRK